MPPDEPPTTGGSAYPQQPPTTGGFAYPQQPPTTGGFAYPQQPPTTGGFAYAPQYHQAHHQTPPRKRNNTGLIVGASVGGGCMLVVVFFLMAACVATLTGTSTNGGGGDGGDIFTVTITGTDSSSTAVMTTNGKPYNGETGVGPLPKMWDLGTLPYTRKVTIQQGDKYGVMVTSTNDNSIACTITQQGQSYGSTGPAAYDPSFSMWSTLCMYARPFSS